MKRSKLVKHLEKHGCYFLREGGNHSLYRNTHNERTSSVPRHTEILDILAEKICRDLEIPKLRKGK